MLPKSVDTLRIDINSGHVRKSISVCQNDSVQRTLNFLLVNNGNKFELDDVLFAEILIHKTDETEVDNGCVIDGNSIQYTLRSNDIAALGINKAQLLLTFNDGETLTTPPFEIVVYSKVLDQSVQESTNEYGALAALLAQANESANNAALSEEEAATHAADAEAQAELAEGFKNQAANYYNDAATEAELAEDYKNQAAASAAEAAEYIVEAGGLILGEDHNKAYYGDQGHLAYLHSQTKGNPHETTAADVGADAAGSAAAALSDAKDYTDTVAAGKQDALTNPLTQADVKDNLDSTDTVKPLSANQGLVLRENISTKVENGTAASTTRTAGEYITRNGVMYKVISNIAANTAFTDGVNVAKKTIGEELTQIKSDLSDSYLLVNTQLSITLATADGVKTVSKLIEDALNAFRNIQVPTGHLYEVIEIMVPYGNGNNAQVTMFPNYPLVAKNSFYNLDFQLNAIRMISQNSIAIYTCSSNFKSIKAFGYDLTSSTPSFTVYNSYDTRVPASGTKFIMFVKDFKNL